MEMPGISVRIQFNIEHLPGYCAALPTLGYNRVLNAVFQIEKDTGVRAQIPLIHQYGPSPQEVPIPFQDQVEDSIEEGMPGAHKGGKGLPLGGNQILFKDDPLIARQYRLAMAD
jgi:hypothetical protein